MIHESCAIDPFQVVYIIIYIFRLGGSYEPTHLPLVPGSGKTIGRHIDIIRADNISILLKHHVFCNKVWI